MEAENRFRRWAGDKLMDAAKRVYGGGEAWYARSAIKEAMIWLDRVEALETERERADRTARECAEFDAAMAACMPAAPATASISLSAPMEDGRPMFQHINDAMLGRT